MHPDSFYRIRLLKDLFRIVAVPCLLLSALLRIFDRNPGLLTLPLHFLFLVASALSRNHYWDWVHAREATRLGAVQIPRVRGKWPGNIDIYFGLVKAAQSRSLGSYQLDLFEQYQSTTLNLRLLWQDLIITMDAKHIQGILATGFNNFWRGPRQKERLEVFLGEGIFNRDDDSWKAHRALARPFFARDRITDFELFERYTTTTLALISKFAATGRPIDVQDLYARFTLDAASEFLFGKNVATLASQLPEPGRARMGAMGSATDDAFGAFAQAFEAAQVRVITRARRGYFWPAFEFFFPDPQVRFRRTIDRWVSPLVEDALDNRSSMRKAGLKSSLDQSVFLEYLADSTEDRKVIQDQLLNILLASRDTTSSLLTSITYLLSEHPDVTRKLRAEVLAHCGPEGAPTFATIKSMRYMRAVINETLRLFPPVPTNARESRPQASLLPESDGTYHAPARPLYVPPSTPFQYLSFLTQRNPALWGADAAAFDPERWLDARLATFTANPMIFTPFSAGPRICIGQNYALNEASCFLVRLLQQFDSFALAPDAQPAGSLPPPAWKAGRGRDPVEKIWPQAALTAFVKGGLWVRFGRAAR
ncbi:uncharacterized protein FIBRA_04822 [Fibroporia radiculosa]|uniref:Cytochrome P450 n=1 Tax=Fibroporia radiculosa TaxID=599839 RepID=J4GPV7_9APHY|nr:uncharacterized protein FIBRA_04822 [Fibroporia radiculosa]CCM02715.1 predicted protein [Fibroporia radiculosa]